MKENLDARALKLSYELNQVIQKEISPKQFGMSFFELDCRYGRLMKEAKEKDDKEVIEFLNHNINNIDHFLKTDYLK